jgi:predicted nuclease with TOPRIM domain
LQTKFEEISEQLELTTNHNEELVLRLEGLEKTVKSYTGEKESVHKRLVELTNLLHSRSVEAEAEKAQLRKQIDKITADIKLTEEMSYP